MKIPLRGGEASDKRLEMEDDRLFRSAGSSEF